MNIQEAKEEIVHTLQAYLQKDEDGEYTFPVVHQRPILLIGPPGVGKTAIMEQVAREGGVGLVAYTMTHHTRQSAIGLPKIVEKTYGGVPTTVTEYTMSEIIASVYETMEKSGNREGILFLDEINCVSETLAPTMLQFLQNKTFGSHRLPAGWVVVAAGNPPEFNKSVREFDVVTLDRVRQINVEADLDVWLDYAREKQLHGAVVSYLTVKPDRFYCVERKDGALAFVTARGWEDLSRVLQSYENLNAPITEALVSQYLRKEETARDFAAYYRLYRKYGTDYGIGELLDGTLTEETYREKVSMAAGGSFDERFSVVNLILESLQARLREYCELDAKVVQLHSVLSRFRGLPQTLPEFIAANENALDVKRKNDLISRVEARREAWVLGRLEQMEVVVRERHIREKDRTFACMKEQFGEDLARREASINAVQKALENAFRFVLDSFGQGQELTLLVTCLSKMPDAQKYFRLHGCEAYLQYTDVLLYRAREEALQKACRAVL
ncbi:MAG: MoxR family ATPase [Eubacteriales bacterium]|nr:MoxR family ATPase [Eubacteriales bacterium]